jgi:mannose-6-phosphate isomerase-like protein (cupin superfamily)
VAPVGGKRRGIDPRLTCLPITIRKAIAGTSAPVPTIANTQEESMTHFVIDKDELPHSGSAHRFGGYLYGGAEVSFFISETSPGKGPSLHAHPYTEVYIVQEGELTFTMGGDTV